MIINHNLSAPPPNSGKGKNGDNSNSNYHPGGTPPGTYTTGPSNNNTNGMPNNNGINLMIGNQSWGLGYDYLGKIGNVNTGNVVGDYGLGMLAEAYNLVAMLGNFGLSVVGLGLEAGGAAIGWADEQSQASLGMDLATLSIVLNQLNNEYAAMGGSVAGTIGEFSAWAKVAFVARFGNLFNNVAEAEALSKIAFCFVSGTKVLTSDGYKNIEDVLEGDRVYCYNFDKKAYELKTVLHKFISFTDTIAKIQIDSEEIIEATLSHLFWVESKKEWIKAKDLLPGMILLSKDGSICKITSIEVEKRIETVYNFEIEELHNYLVSKKALVVHNGDPAFLDYNQALNAAMQWLSDRGFKAEAQNIGKFAYKGVPNGMMTANGKIGFRVEFDPNVGAHINAWAGKEKSPHFLFNASKKTVDNIVKQFLCH
jgi:hypothetical protein